MTSHPVLRIVDANLNRLGEGLRVLEEIARMILNNTALTEQLKTMRHELIRIDRSFYEQLLQSRDSETDVGIDTEVPGEGKEREITMVLAANARRVQESLRTLEEMAKIPDISRNLDSERYKQARFSLYTLEKELLSRLLRQDKLKHLPGLYVIIDLQALKGRDHLEVARQVIRGGARTIQLRDKVQSKDKLLPLAHQLKKLCAEHEILFIINDYLDVALDSDADGLHVGQEDLPVRVARRLLPVGKILGCSTTTVEQAITAQSDGADYIAVGAIFPTLSKTETRVPARTVGLETLRRVKQSVTSPLVAIGGINHDNVSQVVAAGADSIAVISAVLAAESPEEASRQIVNCLEIRG